jgi:hypothetical protein
MHDREFPNTTATGGHGKGHGSVESDTHPNEGGAHVTDTTHGGGEHGQQHPEIDNSERTDIMKTTNMTTSTGAALSLALFLILTGMGSASGFTPQGAGGGEELIGFCYGGGGYGDQQGGLTEGGEVSGGAIVTGQDGTCNTGPTGGDGIEGGQNNGTGVITGGDGGAQGSGGQLRTGEFGGGTLGGNGDLGPSGGFGGSGGGGQGTPDGVGF